MEPRREAISSTFFPVDESLLPQLNITPAQHEELHGYAVQAALTAIRDGPTWGRSNVERAVSSGWEVLSAGPTACFMTKKQTKKKERKGRKRGAAAAQQQEGGQPQQEDDKRVVPPTPRVTTSGVTSLGSFHSTNSVIGNLMPFQSSASVPFEATSGQQFMAHAVLLNSLEDVMNTLYCEHTNEMRAMKTKVYGEAALDCCVLQTLEGATLEDPFWYLGLKWLAVRSPVQAFVASREFVFLEHLGTHVDPKTGRRMLYRVTQSVQIGGYGSQDSYFGLTRGYVEAAFVYWMDDETEVMNPLLHVCAKGRIHMKGSIPDILVYRYLKAFWRSERSLFPACRSSGSSLGPISSTDQARARTSKKKKKKKSRRRKIPSGPPLEMTQEWVADELRPHCSVCNKKFRLVRRFKHHCRVCGEIMCRECMFHHRVNVRAVQSFRGLRGTAKTPADLIANAKAAKHEDAPANFEETMTCSFDKQVGEEDSKNRDFDASLNLVNARKSVDGSAEMAVLGGGAVVYVMKAKVCLRCLQNVPLVNKSKSKSTKRRRHSDMELSIVSGHGVLELNEYSHLRSQTWTPDGMEIEELDGLDDDEARIFDGELDLPMLVVDDTDAASVDGLAETKRRPGSNAFDTRPGSSMHARPGSYAQEWNGHADGGLDSHANHECVMILSPHALSASSSLSFLQKHGLVEKDDDSNDNSGLLERYSSLQSQSSIDSDDNDSIQFYPTQTNRSLGIEKPTPVLDSFFELKDEEKNELVLSAGVARASVRATERVLRRMRDLQDDALYQNRRIPSPSASTTSLCSEDEGDECTKIEKPMRDLRQALAQVESSLADQARILCTIEQERKKKAAISCIFATAAPSKA